MSWHITVAGTVHSDDIITPAGHRPDLLGGSAVYFALAASRYAPIHLTGIVGRDLADAFRALLASPGIDLDGLVVGERPTSRWHARHDFHLWVAVDTSSEEGCDPEWLPVLPPAARRAEVLFVGSMRPSLQSVVLSQASARLIGVDSMTDYTGPHPDAVHAVARSSDILFVNRAELASLTGSEPSDWADAARVLCGEDRLRAVVVKAGPSGAACVTRSDVVEREAAVVDTVVDPTGAGDALAGGFLGACAAAEREDDRFFTSALEEGLRCAALAIGAFGTAGLMTTDRPAAG
jgi:sugar/nucleoside kinase (ribokinase family)